MNDDLRAEMDEAERAVQAAASLGWAPGSGGNLSVDLGDLRPPKGDPILVELGAAVPGLAGRAILVSRSGARFRDLRGKHDLGVVRPLPDGDRAEAWFRGDEQPTFELDTHLALHAALRATGSDARAVLHLHPPSLVALTQVAGHDSPEAFETALLGSHPEVAYHLHRGVGLVPYRIPGSGGAPRESAEAMVRGVGAVVWALHGCFTLGKDLSHCLDRAELLENAARIRLAALATGRETFPLTREQIADVRELREKPRWEEGEEEG